MTRNLKFMLIFIVVLMYANISVVAAEDVNMTLEGHFGGPTRVTVVSGNYAYIGQGLDLVILDISNVSQPIELGRIRTDDAVYDINISGSYAYVADGGNGLVIIDISNPSAPVLVGSCNPGDNSARAYGVAVSGNYAYVAYDNVGLVIINVSNPAIPILTSSYNTAGRAYGVAISGSYAYVADGGSGLVVINVSNPAAPSVLTSMSGYAFDIEILGSYAYVADYYNGLFIIDISNPSALSVVGSYDTRDTVGISVSGNYACVTNNPNGFVIVNVSNAAAPTLAGSYELNADDDFTISGNYVYVAAGINGLVIVDISNPATPILTGSYNTASVAYGFAVLDSYAYVADSNVGLVVVNVSNPAKPVFTSRYVMTKPNNIAVSGNYAYIGCDNGLVIINISNPATPVFVGSHIMAGFYEVAVSGNYAYGANDARAFVIINISNPVIPVFVGSYDTVGSVYDIAISGNYAYIADYTNGFVIINISNPAAPSLEGRYNTGYGAVDVAILGNYVYVACGNGGLVIIDVSNTTSPVQVGHYDTAGGYMRNIAVSGSYAYAAVDNIGLVMIDINNPATPTLTDCYDTTVEMYYVIVSDSYVYATYGINGIITLYTNTSDIGTPPGLTIISSPNGTIVNTFNITISGTAFDESGISNVTVNGVLANGTTNWNADVVLTEGVNIIAVVATDYFGSTNTTSIYVTYDLTPPLINILSPIHNQIYNNNSVNLNYSVLEPTVSEWYLLDGGYNISLLGNTTLDDLLDGNHNLTVFANDSAGNIGSSMVNFTIDTTASTITIDLPIEGYNYNTDTIALNVSADESVTWQYSINGTANVTFTSNTTLNNLPDGNHNVTVYGNDLAGNIGSAMVNFTIDTINPIITIITPKESSQANRSCGQELYVNFTYVEVNPKNYTIQIHNATDIINSIAADTISSPVNISFTMNNTAADGYYNVTVTMWDNASNTDTSTEINAVFMDSTPPTKPTNLTHADDVADGYDNDNITDISWSAATDVYSTVIYNIYRDGVLNGSTTLLAYTFTNEIEGPHTYNVSAIDSVGNINTTNESVTITVDYTDPVIHNLSLSDTSPSYDQEIIVSVNVTDAITNITNVTAGSIQLIHQSGALWNGTITAGYGTNIVTVTAYDNASNTNINSSLSYTGPKAPTPPSSGGSGGGSGSSGEDYENIKKKDVVREQTIINEETSYDFNEELNAIGTIKFTALKNAGEISATIEVLNGRSALVKSDPPGQVYQNMNIWVGKSGFATSDNIADVKVGFRVEKSWIEANGIVVSTIRLCRNHDDVWNPLPTKQSGEDDKYIYFESNTPGFSPFAITGDTEEENTAQGSTIGSMSNAVTEQSDAQSQSEGVVVVDDGKDEQDDKGVSTIWYLVGLLIVLLIGGGVYWIYRMKNDKGEK